MFSNDTADLMLPILLDTANLIRRSMRPGKEPREVKLPQTQMERRSFTEDTLDDDMFDTGTKESTTIQSIIQKYRDLRNRSQRVPFTKINSTKLNEKTTQDKTNNTQINDNLKAYSFDEDNVSIWALKFDLYRSVIVY